jgi:hypothetical protein
MEKIIQPTTPVFHAKITPQSVRQAQAEDKAKAAAKEPKISKVSEKLPQVGPEQPEAEEPKKAQKKEKPKKEPKAKGKKEKEPLTFPVAVRINAYGFLGIRKPLLEALDWHKGMGLKIDKNADGSATVRKA